MVQPIAQVAAENPLGSEPARLTLPGVVVRALPGEFESDQAIAGSVQGIVVFHRPDDYVQTLKAHIDGQKEADVEAAAKEVVQPNSLTWVVVGDRKQIEKSVRELKIGDIEVLDADGKVVK